MTDQDNDYLEEDLLPETNAEQADAKARADDAMLAEQLKSATLLDEEARIMRADAAHGADDAIPADEQKDFLWDVTPEAIKVLKKRRPFIQISQVIDENDTMPPNVHKKIQLESGWYASDYGSAFAASRGEFLFGEGDFRIKLPNDNEDDDGGEGDHDGISNPGKGTWINQAAMTAEELARMAVVREWHAAEIFDADPLMAWAFWAEASYYGLAVFGFEPTAADIAKRNRVKLSRRDLEEAIKERRDIAQLVI